MSTAAVASPVAMAPGKLPLYWSLYVQVITKGAAGITGAPA